jgi:hypothetical protein
MESPSNLISAASTHSISRELNELPGGTESAAAHRRSAAALAVAAAVSAAISGERTLSATQFRHRAETNLC